MQRRPTLDTVAKAAGVSRMTVSNAFNRPDQISAATRDRVLQAARELGYAGPDPAGRSLRRGSTGVIGVLLTAQLPYAFADPGSLMFLHGVATELAQAGRALLLLPGESSAPQGLVRNALVDGFLLVLVAASDPAVADVVERRLPAVSVGPTRIPGVLSLGIDNAAGAATMAVHLLELGHRSVGVVSFGGPGPDVPGQATVRGAHEAMRRRVSGFVSAVNEYGRHDHRRTVVVQAADNSRAAGATAVRTLLSEPPERRPTAVFGVTDVLALGVLDEATRLGLAVPRELSVAGFDDIAESAHSVPPLTTISQYLFDQGCHAARMVLDGIEGLRPEPSELPTLLTVRASTAPPLGSAG